VLSDAGYLLLHEVRLRGLLTIEDGSAQAEVVGELLAAGFVVPARSAIRLTGEGRNVHEQWARVRADSDVEAAVMRAYERFLPLNRAFLRLCNDWQLRPGNVPNDHRDPSYDWTVLDRLQQVHEQAAPIVRRVARSLTRFETYPRRFQAAIVHVHEGERDWFTSPRIDSYHTVWMQLHEDLLLALGRRREHEPPT
jgi:hypothetical protein